MSMQTILAASQSMTRMQTMQSTRSQLQGQANVLRSEIRQDGGNEKKEAQADALEEKSNLLMDNLMDEMTDVNETLKPDEEDKTEPDAKTDAVETAKQPRTDTLTLSDSAAQSLEKTSPAKVVSAAAVTYKADGSTASSAPTKSAHALKATA